MKRCKKCKAPISGVLSKVLKKVVKLKPSDKFLGLCNKCEPKIVEGKYLCQICGREVDESAALMHVKTEEYLLELIRRDHPEWKEAHGTCRHCVDYYRALVNKAEI
jgi:hypothetical protein